MKFKEAKMKYGQPGMSDNEFKDAVNRTFWRTIVFSFAFLFLLRILLGGSSREERLEQYYMQQEYDKEARRRA